MWIEGKRLVNLADCRHIGIRPIQNTPHSYVVMATFRDDSTEMLYIGSAEQAERFYERVKRRLAAMGHLIPTTQY